LPRIIAERELEAVAANLNWPEDCFHVVEASDSVGPGNVVVIELHSANVREVFTGFGRYGARAAHVAGEAVDELRSYLAANVPVGKHLADQLLLPLAVAAWKSGAASRFHTLPLTRHSRTHIDVVKKFLNVRINVEQDGATIAISVNRPDDD
jgi:RNA 3'-terminal phosphate cyclase (ATP)